jgi:hypothetical protein
MLEYNITQFSHEHSVLRSGGSNHVNHYVHLELTTKRLKEFSVKKSTADYSYSNSDENIVKLLQIKQ